MITNPKSVFPIVTFDSTDSWDAVLTLASSHLDKRGLDRLRNVLNGKCQCIVIERHYIDKDYRDTFSHFHSKRFNTPDSRCVRLHFFSRGVTEDTLAAGDEASVKAYLGYSVIRPTKPNCVGRTLLDDSLRLSREAHLSKCKEIVSLLGTSLSVGGFPFISQDADATVCAQSALWMLMRYYSNRYSLYSEILPFQITNLANRHALGSRIYPSSGLYSWQLAEALRLQKFSPIIYSRNCFTSNFDHLLYTYIESGLPLLVTVPGHVVAAYGHLSDYTQPAKPGTALAYTSNFNHALVISDDNCFPYQMLRQSAPNPPADSKFTWPEIEEFIVPLPEKVFLTAELAQEAIEAILKDSGVGIQTSPILNAKKLVFRLFLTSAQSFKRALHKRGMGHKLVEQIYRVLPMPHFIWVCEIADYDEYAQHRKVLGEVIWDATRNAREPNGWIALHFPEKLVVDVGSALNRNQTLKSYPLSAQNSYSLFVSNLHSL